MESKNININDAVIGKYCIVRGDRFGVFAGTVDAVDGDRVLLKDARRLWFWSGACSCSQLATDGPRRPSDCKFAVPVPSIVLSGVIEIIPATDNAMGVIMGVQEWKM